MPDTPIQVDHPESDDPHPRNTHPALLHEGLAVYAFGEGAPLLLMPYPHGATVVGGPTLMALVEGLRSLGRKVVTFDPPGAGRSDRPMRLGLPEVLGCAEEALGGCGIGLPTDVVGHSQGGFAALAFAIERPERVRRLVLIGAGAGGPSWMRAPGAIWNRSHPEYGRFGLTSSLYWLTRRLAAQKLMYNLVFENSYADRTRFFPDPISPFDWLRPAHPRTRWGSVARRLDYAPRLGEVRAPTLLMVGREDPQMPPACSEELARGIPDARLVVFEKSGHYPFLEETDAFWTKVRGFLGPP